jgi:hypothetical protein
MLYSVNGLDVVVEREVLGIEISTGGAMVCTVCRRPFKLFEYFISEDT